MAHRLARILTSLVLLLSAACASAPAPQLPRPVSFAEADALVRDGCYDCLKRARAMYEAALASLRGPAARRLFETELLIALRERELALPSSGATARARALADDLPPSVDVSRYIDLVDGLPHDRHGWPRSEMAALRRARGLTAAAAAETAAWVRGGTLRGPFAEYLATAIECTYGPRPPASGSGPSATPPASSPEPGTEPPTLVRYRRAICGTPDRAGLEAVRAAVPAFVETSFFLAQIAVSSIAEGGAGNPHALVAEALEWMPQSPAATYLAGALQYAVADWARAIGYYDQTIAQKPVHEDAWLGRTVSLTELSRRAEAIAAASRMIDLGLDNVPLALYWRAFNHHASGNLAAARADLDRARAQRANEEILTLAGIVEHDQGDLIEARRDLERVRDMNGKGTNCRALWYLGSVYVKERLWPEAGPTFEAAMVCYDEDARSRESTIASLERNTAIDAVFKASRIARLREEIRIQRRQHLSSAFNAASFHAFAGDLEKASRFVEVAAGDPDLGDEIDELRRHMAAVAAARAPGKVVTE